MRALPDADLKLFNFSQSNNVAILRYKGAECEDPKEDPSVNVPALKLPLVETNLHVSCASLISSLTGLTFFLSSHLFGPLW